MSEMQQKLEKIEAEHQSLTQKLDDGQIEYEQFEREVDALPTLQIGGKEWRINRAGQWGYWQEDAWVLGDIRQAIGGGTLPIAIAPPPTPPAALSSPPTPSPEAAETTTPLPVLVLVVGGAALLLLAAAVGGILWVTSRREDSKPIAVTVVASPTATQPASPTPTPIPPTPTLILTPTLTPIPPTSTPTPSLPVTPTPSPSPTPTETPPPTATPKSISSPTATPPPSLRGKIAYADYDMTTATYHIYLLDLTNPTPVKLIENAAQPSFRPDGKQIAYRSWAPDSRGLWVQNLDGSDLYQLSRGYESARPQWSPDGSNFIHTSCQSGDRQWQLYYPIDVEIKLPGPAWAADWLSVDKLIYVGVVNEQPGLYLANVDGSDPVLFTPNRTDTAPAVSYDSRYVAYTSLGDGGNNWDVYVVTADGSSIRRLTTHPARDGIPAWSPDGAYIAFASDRDGVWGIWVVDATGQGQSHRLVALTSGLDLHPFDAPPDQRHDWTLHTISWSP